MKTWEKIKTILLVKKHAVIEIKKYNVKAYFNGKQFLFEYMNSRGDSYEHVVCDIAENVFSFETLRSIGKRELLLIEEMKRKFIYAHGM